MPMIHKNKSHLYKELKKGVSKRFLWTGKKAKNMFLFADAPLGTLRNVNVIFPL